MAVLEAGGLGKAFRGRKVVRHVDLCVSRGEIVGLLGANGAGKTTTFNMVAGLLTPDSGWVRLDGEDLGKMPLYARARRGLGYLPQESTVFRGLSVQENIWVALEAQGVPASKRDAAATEVLQRFGLHALKHSLGSQLSGGERRRLEMARTLVQTPKVVLLDEPFAGVDPIAVGDIKGFIQDLGRANLGVLITDHNVHETLRICDRAYILHDGAVLVAGTPEEIVANAEARKAYLGADFSL